MRVVKWLHGACAVLVLLPVVPLMLLLIGPRDVWKDIQYVWRRTTE
jgi:hypothetical protein